MKFLNILTLILSGVACSAFVKNERENSGDERRLGMPDSVRMSFYEMEKGGKKGGKKGHKDGKKGGGGKGGKGDTGDYGGNGMAPAASPVADCGTPTCGETPTCDSDTPGCGEALSPASPVATPVIAPTCNTTVGCGAPVASPAYAEAPSMSDGSGEGSGKGSGEGSGMGSGKGSDKGSGKGSGKGYDKGSVEGKKGGKKDSGSGKGDGNMAPATSPTSDGACGCEIQEIELDFTMLPYNISVGVTSGASTSEVGTVFIFNDPLYDLNLTILDGTFVGGLCHKTQLTQPVGSASTLVGGGYCFFTFTVSDGDSSVTFNAAGEVFDVLGGTLAVTGGTGALAGAYGEVEITPVYETNSLVDYFSEASLYIGAASLFVPLF
jgi:hypothetical protein